MSSSREKGRLPQRTGQLGGAGAAVSVAGAVANALAFLVPVLGARTLSPGDLGAIATIMAILAIASVPGMGLQLAIGVAVARHGAVAGLNRLIGRVTAWSVLPLLLLTPVLASQLKLPWPVVPLTAVITASVVAGSGWLGVAQGQMRFNRLATGMALLGVARCGGIIIGLAAGLDLVALMAIGAAIALLMAACVYVLAPHAPAAVDLPDLVRGVWVAGAATLALFAVSYADLIAARILLSETGSAEYAVLNVLTKGAIWAPAMVSIVALPYFARQVKRSRTIAAALVAGIGAILVLATVLFGGFALRLAGGPDYVHLARLAPLFAISGALYALVYLLTNAQVAGGAKAPSAPLWAAFAGFVIAVAVLPDPSIGAIAVCAIVAAVVSLAALVMLSPRRPAPLEPPERIPAQIQGDGASPREEEAAPLGPARTATRRRLFTRTRD